VLLANLANIASRSEQRWPAEPAFASSTTSGGVGKFAHFYRTLLNGLAIGTVVSSGVEILQSNDEEKKE